MRTWHPLRPIIREMTDTERIDRLEKAIGNGDVSIFVDPHGEIVSITYLDHGIDRQVLGINLRDAIDGMKDK